MTNPVGWLWGRFMRRPPIVRLLLGLLAVVVAISVGWVMVYRLTDDSCAPGVVRSEDDEGDEECIGVTDGGFHFFDGLGPVSDQIKKENDRVTAGEEPYATIALMIPMTQKAQETVERTQVIREVQGAYLAQRRANQQGAPHPPIRLVLANPGRHMTSWRQVSEQLGRMSRSAEDKLRVVFGFNLSIDRTQATIDHLTKTEQIAVVGGPITADSLANDEANPKRYPGLAKMVPSNLDQARALADYLGVDPQETFLVEDTSETDIYAESLRTAFREVTKGTLYAPEQYDARQAIPNDFVQIVNNLCDSQATTIYFSGRPAQLALLVNALGKRGCMDRKFNVVTVSGASTLALDPTIDWGAFTRGKGLSVEYATVTHEDAWTTSNHPQTGGSPEDFMAVDELVRGPRRVGPIGPTGLADGRTITTHDSALTAIQGIRNRTTKKGEVPALEDIPAAWPRLHGPQKVRGASGWICLTSYGTPYNKAVAIVRLTPAGDHIQFVELAWPEGKPPPENCKAGPD